MTAVYINERGETEYMSDDEVFRRPFGRDPKSAEQREA